ncbi:helix-turn-helix domain-containing protein [Sphingobacterium faecium]|uniref:helix-turn-helix domain-containing protein n=1 Tax=Sphingobacterium faecium TaxID=34087 RepID=UPI00247B0473|nr:helix-turn-helix transcriptional regulator [Sphingobacterium faecium]WGQ15028.1 helix-turn-helix transcriptional regulator [Sphingobacterium faecium]
MDDFNIKIEFGKQAKKFRLHFGLGQKEIADLSDMSLSEYSDLENGKTNYNVEKIQDVSSVYGLFYYQLGNPTYKFPAFTKLPKETQSIINNRKEPLKVYNTRLIVEHLGIIFSAMPEGTEFLIKNINSLIEQKFKISYENEEISGTINKKFKDYICKTTKKDTTKLGVGAKPIYYKITRIVPLEMEKEEKKSITK